MAYRWLNDIQDHFLGSKIGANINQPAKGNILLPLVVQYIQLVCSSYPKSINCCWFHVFPIFMDDWPSRLSNQEVISDSWFVSLCNGTSSLCRWFFPHFYIRWVSSQVEITVFWNIKTPSWPSGKLRGVPVIHQNSEESCFMRCFNVICSMAMFKKTRGA